MNKPISIESDQEYTVSLDSSIVYATWKVMRVYGGATAEIEVRTAFVGDNVPVQIRLEGEESGALGSVDDTIFGNRYCADIPIPSSVQVDEKVWFVVKLPRHSLQATSAKIPAIPPIQCVKIGWGQQVARRGDVIDIKAEFLGLRDVVSCDVHILEYDRDGNHDPINIIPTEIRNGKLNLQWEYEYYEDTDEIPTEEELQEYGSHYNPPEYFFVVEIDGQRFGELQESGLLEFKDYCGLNLLDEYGKVLSNHNISLLFPDGSECDITTDENGAMRNKDTPPGKVRIKFLKRNNQNNIDR